MHTASADSWQQWKTQDHAETFDFWRESPTWDLRRRFEGFNEFQFLKETTEDLRRRSLLDVGCATGELYRYLAAYHPTLSYIGVDVSDAAVNRARRKYPTGNFSVVSPDLRESRNWHGHVGIVWSRDVVHHQPNPLLFLERILALEQEVTVLRVRTRDHGSTVLDARQSCQWQYGGWAPYIVLNVDELTEAITSSTPVRRIEYRKRYEVLGGHHGRFLPKACYDPRTGTAETAALIVHGDPGPKGTEVEARAAADGPLRDSPMIRGVRYVWRRLRR